jgi:hypothetical protein
MLIPLAPIQFSAGEFNCGRRVKTCPENPRGIANPVLF